MIQTDCLFITASSAGEAYQDLAHKYMAIEPPTWSLLLAESARSKGFQVKILDAIAENLNDHQVVERIRKISPRLCLFVVYGQNPNAGTTGMIGAIRTCRELKQAIPNSLVGFVGSHVSSLPKQVLSEVDTDMVFTNEGVYALLEVLGKLQQNKNWKETKGIGYKNHDEIIINEGMPIVKQEDMDRDLPGYAWDLLPFDENPLDLYRAHYWHAEFNDSKRSPFAAIYTSLGCVFGCEFCMINILNREDMSDKIHAGNSRVMRFWSDEWVAKELKKLSEYGVKTLRFSDEMFFFRRDKYMPIINEIINKGYDFNIWAYARIDTVKTDDLKYFKQAGINWLCLGIEAGNRMVRMEISKGSFKDVRVDEIVNSIQDAGMYVLGNYIFGFPEDTIETMQETLDMALELNTEHANFYACTALPGSALYYQALEKGWYVPEKLSNASEFAFLGYDHIPLPTNHLDAKTVLKFRDSGWNKYFTNQKYLDLVKKKFGATAVQNIIEMSKIKLKRKILE